MAWAREHDKQGPLLSRDPLPFLMTGLTSQHARKLGKSLKRGPASALKYDKLYQRPSSVPDYVYSTTSKPSLYKVMLQKTSQMFTRHLSVTFGFKQELGKARPVQFGALPAAAEQLFTKPRSRPKIEPNFEALAWFFLWEKPPKSYEAGGLVNSLVSGTPKI